MKKLIKPTLSIGGIIEDCCDTMKNTQSVALRQRLSNAKNMLVSKSYDYDRIANSGGLSTIATHSTVDGSLSADDMVGIYDNRFVKTHYPLRQKYYDIIMSISENGSCPFCGRDHVSTLDHFLAKTKYPSYAILPYNLVPCCSDCNKKKLNIINNILHPYYDDVSMWVWLYSNIFVQNRQLCVDYKVIVPEDMDKDLARKLENQYFMLDLRKRYIQVAIDEITNSLYLWKKLALHSEETLRDYFSNVRKSREAINHNSYSAALYRGLETDSEIVYDFLHA